MNRCADGLFGDASHHAAYCAHSVYLVTHQPIEDLFGSAEMHSEARCKKYVKWRHYCFARGSVDERVRGFGCKKLDHHIPGREVEQKIK